MTSSPSTSTSWSATRMSTPPSSRPASSCCNWCTAPPRSFARVALYSENSLLPPDLKLLPSAAAAVSRFERLGAKTVVESAAGVGHSVAGRRARGWRTLAGAGWRDTLAAGRRARRRTRAAACGSAPGPSHRRLEGGARGGRQHAWNSPTGRPRAPSPSSAASRSNCKSMARTGRWILPVSALFSCRADSMS